MVNFKKAVNNVKIVPKSTNITGLDQKINNAKQCSTLGQQTFQSFLPYSGVVGGR